MTKMVMWLSGFAIGSAVSLALAQEPRFRPRIDTVDIGSIATVPAAGFLAAAIDDADTVRALRITPDGYVLAECRP